MDFDFKNTELDTTNSKSLISTITATASLGCYINIENLYININVLSREDNTSNGFTWIEYGKKNSLTLCKGFHKKMTIYHRKRIEGKRFDKQLTVLIRNFDKKLNKFIYCNVKIFYNGNIQMTGLKSNEQGFWVLYFICSTLHEIKRVDNKIYTVPEGDNQELKPYNYIVQLINSNFNLGFNVNRDNLNEIVSNQYNIFCSFESCIYPGVKIQYYYNENNEINDGKCKCSGICQGKGSGSGDNNCKKVTIIVFQSGSIIITGSKNTSQINHAFCFINELIAKHLHAIKKNVLFSNQPYQPKTKYKKSTEKRKFHVPIGYMYDMN